jgi:hypothetical protein
VIPNTEKTHHRHVPHLLVNTETHKVDPKQGTLQFPCGHQDQQAKPSKKYAGWSLDNCDIEFSNRILSPRLSVNTDHILKFSNCFPSELPYGGEFDTHHLCTQLPDQVSARVLLARGELKASWVHPTVQWRFMDPMGPPMWLAQKVCHSFVIKGDQLSVRLKGFTGCEDRLTVNSKKQQHIEIQIGNTLPDEIIPKKADDRKPEIDHHVKMYHDLCSAPAPAHLRRALEPVSATMPSDAPQVADLTPEESSDPRDVETLTVGGANCPPTFFSGSRGLSSGPGHAENHH